MGKDVGLTHSSCVNKSTPLARLKLDPHKQISMKGSVSKSNLECMMISIYVDVENVLSVRERKSP